MVLFFKSNVTTPEHTIYMGEDKVENEDLIKWGWPEDVWFHVDKVSSAHVYLRLLPGETIDTISPALLQDCAQLVKANSIEGNKMSNVGIVYTMWDNLKKTGNMAVGQVGFNVPKEVKSTKVEKRVNEVVNRLNKTLKKDKPDLKNEREERDRREREAKKAELREQKRLEKLEEERRKKEAESRQYNFLKQENMKSNYDSGNESDDFM